MLRSDSNISGAFLEPIRLKKKIKKRFVERFVYLSLFFVGVFMDGIWRDMYFFWMFLFFCCYVLFLVSGLSTWLTFGH